MGKPKRGNYMFQAEIQENYSGRTTRIIRQAAKRTTVKSHHCLNLKLQKQKFTGKRPQMTFPGGTNKMWTLVVCSASEKGKTRYCL